MSSTPSKRAFERWDNSNGADDFLQLGRPDGTILAWIDANGVGQGALVSSPSGGASSTGVINAKDYGVKADGVLLIGTSVSITSGSKTVTCSIANFTSADIGKIIFGTNGAGGQLHGEAGVLVLPQGTITAINSPTSVQVSVAATITSTASVNTQLIYGTDDTAGLAAAWAALIALPNCSCLQLPMGIMINQAPQFTTTNANHTSQATEAGSGDAIIGYGPSASTIMNTPNFAFTNNGSSLFAGASFMVFKDWSIHGGGLGTNGNNTNTILSMGTECVCYNFEIIDWLGADSNTIGLNMNGRLFSTRVQGSGGTGANVSGSVFTVNCVVDYSKFRGITIPAGQTLRSINSFFGGNDLGQIGAVIDGTVISKSDQWVGATGNNTNNIAVEVRTGGVLNLDSSSITAPGNSTSVGLFNSSGTVTSRSTNFTGGSSGGSAYQGVGTASFTELDGANTYATATNKITNPSTATFIPFRTVSGAGTGVAAASSTLGLYGTGPNVTDTTLNSTTIGSGIVMDRPYTLRCLQAFATAGGANASSGVVTVLKNGSPTSLTCTLGTGTYSLDGVHTVTGVIGDLISLQITTQGSETLAGVKVSVGAY